MDLKEFDYELPEELIAQHPENKRDESRLMVLHKETGVIEHRHFYDIIDYLKPGDVLVRNTSKVIPARLYGTKKPTGAKVEVLILKMENMNRLRLYMKDFMDFATKKMSEEKWVGE